MLKSLDHELCQDIQRKRLEKPETGARQATGQNRKDTWGQSIPKNDMGAFELMNPLFRKAACLTVATEEGS